MSDESQDTPTTEAPETPAIDGRRPSYLETMLLVILAQQDVLLMLLRAEPDEIREAIKTKFDQAGVEVPPGLLGE